MRVAAVTFDLWDTIFVDGSDEEERRRRGLPPKAEARALLLHEALEGRYPLHDVRLALATATAAFDRLWKREQRTWTVRQRLSVALEGLGAELPAGRFDALVRAQERMELDPRPRPVPGMAEALRAVAERWPVAVISDAVWSPGRSLRELLAAGGLLELFSALVFSDELGRSKPHRRPFEAAAAALGVEPAALVHVGDREANDVDGPHGVGARAVLFTAAVDRGSARSRAEAICRSPAELLPVLERLDRGALA